MASAAALEPGSTLYELSQSLDLTGVPEKLVCKNCSKFLINAYKNACCDGALCEMCNTEVAGSACPFCKHSPAVSNPSKALRNTAKAYLKTLEKQEASKNAAAAVATATPDQPVDVAENAAPTESKDSQSQDPSSKSEDVSNQSGQESAINDEIVQSIEQPKPGSRRATMDSNTSANDPDDDDDEIEIKVGDYDMSEMPDTRNGPMEDDWYGDEQQYYTQEKSGRDSTRPHKQERTNSIADASRPDMNQHNMPPEAMFANGMNNMNNMPMSTCTQFFLDLSQALADSSLPVSSQDMAQMQQMFQSAMTNPAMAQQMMHGYPNMQNMFQMMQSMSGMQGMPMAATMNGNQSWAGNMMPFGNQSFNPMMNNASFYQGQQFQNFQNGNFRDNRSGNFRGGRGRNKRGRGQYFQQQDHFATGFNSSFQNYGFQNGYDNSNNNNGFNQLDNSQQDSYSANNHNSSDQALNDDDDDAFAPGGQDEVQEALGEEYTKKKTPTPQPDVPEPSTQQDVEPIKHEDYQEEPSTHDVELHHEPDSPQHHQQHEEIAEAYREDLDYPTNNGAAPPFAPSGPSGKDVPFRARGHGRYPSRARGSFHGSNGYPPRSPARPVSQHNNLSPSHGLGPSIVGAPTGPRAMREKDLPPSRTLNRTESDTGFKIRGTATQVKDQRLNDQTPRSATPRSGYEDDYDRDAESSRRRANRYDRNDRNDRRRESRATNNYDQYEDESNIDRKRRKSRRADDYDDDMQDTNHSYSRDASQDRARRRDKEKDKSRDKYSKHKSRRDEYDREEESDDRSKHKKRDDRERRDRDYERAEKDKHRKRSRHDRDEYEDDEEESHRRSRKHKKDHKDREDTDLGMRITGRSRVESPAPDKDPHTLEREKRNKERLEKEQQRRQNAAKGDLSGGRTRSVKYEDELDVRGGRYSSKSRRR